MNRFRIAAALLALWAASPAGATLTIQVNYTGDAKYQPYFTAAATAWENLLVGYQDGGFQVASTGSSYNQVPPLPVGTPLTTVYITASVADIEESGVLGSAGPTGVALDLAGYVLATDGVMTFDSEYAPQLVADGSFGAVVMHEMAHVLGFGTLWERNAVYVAESGAFLGPNATAYWQSEFGQTGAPAVELGGGGGTAGVHWDEIDGGDSFTGVTDTLGRDMRDELMTGWLNSDSFVSDMTIASFIDIGFLGSVAPIPEASGLVAMGLVFVGLAMKRRRAGE